MEKFEDNPIVYEVGACCWHYFFLQGIFYKAF